MCDESKLITRPTYMEVLSRIRYIVLLSIFGFVVSFTQKIPHRNFNIRENKLHTSTHTLNRDEPINVFGKKSEYKQTAIGM